MSWWQNIQNIFKPKPKNYSFNDIISLIFPSRSGNMIASNSQALEQSVWIMRAIQSIAQTGASIPWHIYNQKGEVDKEAEDRLKKVNKDFTFTEILEKTLAWQCIEGYAPWYVEMGVITPLDADMLEISRSFNGTYSYRYKGYTSFPLLDENIILFPNFSPYAKILGLSELKTCIDVANLGENAIRLANNIMLSGGLLTGMLSTEQDITVEEANELRRKFKEKYGGIENSGDILVAGRGIKYTKLGISPGEFSVLDLTKVTREGVSVAFGVPEIYLAGTEHINYANSKTQEAIFIKTTIIPKNDRLADRITAFVLPKLFPNKKYTFAFDWSKVEALQGDKLAQAQIDDINIRNGKSYINEIRARDGLEPVPWGNSYWGSLSQVPLDTVKAYQENLIVKLDSLEKEIKKDKEVINKVIKRLTENERKKIWRRFIARVDPQEKRLVKEINKYLQEQKEVVIEKLKQEAKDIEDIKTKGIEDIEYIPENWDKKFAKMLKPYILAFMQQAGDEAVNEYGVGITFDLQKPELQKWIEWKLNGSAVKVNEVTRDAIKEQLKEAVKNGEGIDQMVDRISGLFEQTYARRAETISRTEVISANNKAFLEGMKQCGLKTKEWLTAIDERTRDAHEAVDGQVKNIEEKFEVGGEELDFPGDPSGSPENIINCRCQVIYGGKE